MTDDPSTVPPAVPRQVAAALEECSVETLEAVAAYARTLADRRSGGTDDVATTEPSMDDSADESSTAATVEGDSETGARTHAAQEAGDDPPADVPAKATVTVKEINDNRYYYWQWREGDTIRSKYKAPVDPDE